MGNHRKHWTKEEKLTAVRLSEKEGVVSASRQLGVSITSLYQWRDKLNAIGENALDRTDSSGIRLEYARLIRENKQLKELVADKELPRSGPFGTNKDTSGPVKKKSITKEESVMVGQEYIEQGFPVKKVLNYLAFQQVVIITKHRSIL